MNKTVARLITRGNSPDGTAGTVDMILGVGFKEGTLKPNTIYEIRDILGELILVEVGSQFYPKVWNKGATRIFQENKHCWLTQDEISKLV